MHLHRSRSLLAGLALAVIALLPACGHNPAKPQISSVAPDFSLADVNPNSPTTGQQVSPRQQLARISAWYFGHAT